MVSASSLLLGGAAAPSHDFWAAGKEDALALSLLDRMSDEAVLGQLLMIAYPGAEPPPLLYKWIESRGLGGVKIFGWNAEDTDRLAVSVAALQRKALAAGAGIPLLIATDQEGGWIRHVKGATTISPGNMAIGASGRPYDAFRSAYLIGRELAALGVNMNFAPTVDLATRPKSQIIGPRAFSSDPMEAAALGAAFARGLAEAGVIATAKHFPGHGDTEQDSHGVLPVLMVDEKTLWDRELVPYRMLAAEGIPAIMSGHLSFPLITRDGSPASLSPFFMTEVLRKRIGFTGIAVTDDLYMTGAAGDGAAVSQACLRAIEAGNDIVMMSRLPELDDQIWTRLISAYRERPAFKARAREAALRVITAKLRYLKPLGKDHLIPDPRLIASRVPDPEAAPFFRDMAFRSATALGQSRLPFSPSGRLLLAGPFQDFLAAGTAAYPGAASYRFSWHPDSGALPAELDEFERLLPGASSVLVCVANAAGMDFAERAHAAGKRVAILSVQSPAPLSRASWAEAAVAVYGYSRESIQAGIDVLSGAATAQGRLPIVLGK